MRIRTFILQRDVDVSGVSGTGTVASGIHWVEPDIIALRWNSEFPTSVVFHERGLESMKHVHGHDGKTRIIWLNEASI